MTNGQSRQRNNYVRNIKHPNYSTCINWITCSFDGIELVANRPKLFNPNTKVRLLPTQHNSLCYRRGSVDVQSGNAPRGVQWQSVLTQRLYVYIGTGLTFWLTD